MWGDENFPPFEFKDETGRAQGFNIELLTLILEKLEKPYVIHLANWDEIQEAIDQDKVDLIASVIRLQTQPKNLYFGNTFQSVNKVIVVPAASDIYSPIDLDKKNLLVDYGAFVTQYLQNIPNCSPTITVSDKKENLLPLLINGNFDAVITCQETLNYILQKEKNGFQLGKKFRVIEASIKPFELCFAGPLRRKTLIKEMNKTLFALDVDETYNQLKRKWFTDAQENSFRQQNRLYSFLGALAILIALFFLFRWIVFYKKSVKHKKSVIKNVQLIIDHLPTPIYVVNYSEEKKPIFWNAAAKVFFSSKTYKHFTEKESNSDLKAINQAIIETGKTDEKVDSIQLEGESRVDLLTYKARIYYQEKACIEIVHTNITELIEAQKTAEKEDQRKTEFLSNISHEIRTPLNAIVGFSSLLPETLDQETRKEYIQIINSKTELLHKLINDIIDLAKIESGKFQLTSDFINLEPLFNDCCDIIEHSIPAEKEVTIKRVCPYEQVMIPVDSTTLHQIIRSFASNAVKFTQKGTIEIGLIHQELLTYIYVKDPGIGIPLEKQVEIFDRFNKIDSFSEGTGLGLAICMAIAKIYKGEVGVYSRVGEGSIFWIAANMRTESIEKEQVDWEPIQSILEKLRKGIWYKCNPYGEMIQQSMEPDKTNTL